MIPDDLFDQLCRGARYAVKQAWDAAHGAVAPGAPVEVDHIFALTNDGVRELAAQWGPILRTRGISLRVTGVFCHQTPKASYTHPTLGSKGPELGDILFVHEHTDLLPGGGRRITRKAVLIQAKMVDNGVPKTVDEVQEYLYEHWPLFELKGRGAAGGSKFLSGKRDIAPNTGGSRYGLIERHAHTSGPPWMFPYCCAFPWTFSDPGDPIRSAGGEDAGAFLTNMLFDSRWTRGRACVPVSPFALSTGSAANNHFDLTVDELLALTAQKTLRFKRHPHIYGKRGVSLTCFQTDNGLSGTLSPTGLAFTPSGDGPSPPGEDIEPEDGEGISVVLLESAGEAPSERGSD